MRPALSGSCTCYVFASEDHVRAFLPSVCGKEAPFDADAAAPSDAPVTSDAVEDAAIAPEATRDGDDGSNPRPAPRSVPPPQADRGPKIHFEVPCP